MYGTIARLRVKPGHVGGLKLVMQGGDMPPGAVALYVYQMDANPNELWLAVVFESKEAYLANAQSAEQHQRYLDLMAYLEAEPEWHDGEILFSKVSQK